MAAESNGQEKTEQATAKRRRDARKEGNVFSSKDVSTVAVLIGVLFLMRLTMPGMFTAINQYLKWIIGLIGGSTETVSFTELSVQTASVMLYCVLPLLLGAVVLEIISHGAQTRFNVSFHPLKPKFSKLNPITGIKNMFSMKRAVELIKNLLKVILLVVLLYKIMIEDAVQVGRMVDMLPINATAYTMQMGFDLVLRICMAFMVIAFFDFLYQRWQYEKDLRMTKQEVKEEFKQTEGNPEIKGRIRRQQRQMAMSRMMQKVPQADVIIRNPTHFAVALKYDPHSHGAPVVLAKGQDELALRIIKVGEENGVFIMENRPLARALYSSCELDREIPAEFYGAVAEILVYIYKATHREDMFT